MDALFGYCGLPLPGLIEAMARSLAHRHRRGWDQVRLKAGEGFQVCLAHGHACRQTDARVWADDHRQIGFGYAGAFFDPPGPEASAQALCRKIGTDVAVLQQRDGAFVAALASGSALHLVRDATGIKTLYWTRHRDRLLFASEIKALLADPQVNRRLRPASVTAYLTFSYVPGEHTMLEGIFELQPGHTLTLAKGKVTCQRHYVLEPEAAQRQAPDTQALVGRVRASVEDAVSRCCRVAGRPPAVFVSGGIDSSAVLALTAKKFPDTPIDTYSIHFGSRYENENTFVSQVVDRYRTRHTWLEIRPGDFLHRMRHIIWCLDDPIGDPITVPNFLMAEAASRKHSVVLNGEGGDPCFGGPKNIPMMLASLYGPLGDNAGNNWLAYDYLYAYRKCFSDLKNILTPDAWQASGGEDALCGVVAPLLNGHRPRGFLNRLMAVNIRLKGANLILPKVEKMTAANGVLALPPLFTRQVADVSMACPPQLKLAGNVEKWILKQAVADLLPPAIVHRPKSGMMVPVRFWFQKEMRRWARRVLNRRAINATGLFDVKYVKALLGYDSATVRGGRCGLKLWMLCTFMLWYDQMIAHPPGLTIRKARSQSQ